MSEGMLMNAVVVRRKVMQYRDHEFQYEVDGVELGTESGRDQSADKDYRRKRPLRSSRRRSSKATSSHPGYGMSGRRNHRWAW
jgi:hypothetical protein